MAFAKSLGVHVPSALEFLVKESILPPDADEHLYKWDIYDDGESALGEEELVTTDQCVVWSQGGVIQRVFKLDLEGQQIIQALLTWFHVDVQPSKQSVSSEFCGTGATAPLEASSFRGFHQEIPTDFRASSMHRALVVILKQQAHIYLLHGPSHVVNLPIEVERAFPAPRGLILQRKLAYLETVPVSPTAPDPPPSSFRASQLGNWSSPSSWRGNYDLQGSQPSPVPNRLPSTMSDFAVKPRPATMTNMPRLFAMTDPLLDLGLVVETPRDAENSLILAPIDPLEEVLHVSPMNQRVASNEPNDGREIVLLTVNREQQRCSVWYGSYTGSTSLKEWSEQEAAGAGLLSLQHNGWKPTRSNMTADTTGSPATVAHARAGNLESLAKPMPSSSSTFTTSSAQTNRNSSSFNFERSVHNDEAYGIIPDISSPDKKSAANRRTSSIVARAELATHELNPYKEWVPNSASTAAFSANANRNQNLFAAAVSRKSLHSSSPSGMAQGGIPNVTDKAEAIRIEDSESILLGEPRKKNGYNHTPDFHSQDPFDPLRRELVMRKALSIALHPPRGGKEDNSALTTLSQNTEILTFSSRTGDMLSIFILDRDHAVLSEICMHVAQTTTENSNSDTEMQVTDESSSYPSLRRVIGNFAVNVTNGILDAVKIRDGEVSALAVLKRSSEGRLNLSLLSLAADVSDAAISHSDSASLLERCGTLHVQLEQPLKMCYSNLLRRQKSMANDLNSTSDYQDVLSSVSNASHCLKHPGPRGEFDLIAADGIYHRYQLQLRPRNALVMKILNASRFALRNSQRCSLLSTWWYIHGRYSIPNPSSEWRSLVVTLFTLVIILLQEEGTITEDDRHRMHESLAQAITIPQNRNDSWNWIAVEPEPDSSSAFSNSFLVECSQAARDYLNGEDRSEDISSPMSSKKHDEQYPTALAELLVSLHLIREEEKLNINSEQGCSAASFVFVPMLAQLGLLFGWTSWTARPGCYYSFEGAADRRWEFQSSPVASFAIPPPPFDPPSVYELIRQATESDSIQDFAKLANNLRADATGNYNLWNLPRIRQMMEEHYAKLTPRMTSITATLKDLRQISYADGLLAEWPLAEKLLESPFSCQILETLPEGCVAMLRAALQLPILGQVRRQDIHKPRVSRYHAGGDSLDGYVCTRYSGLDIRNVCVSTLTAPVPQDSRGPREAMRIMFRGDTRSSEPAMLLCPQLVPVAVMHPTPGSSEAQFLEAQQSHAKLVYTRTMAVVAGQALLDYQCHRPLPTQKLEILLFNTSCRMQPSGITVNADRSNFVEEKVSWAFFHAGVQTGLRITKDAKDLDTSWLYLNKPAELGNRHAGLLLALGLSGHLKSMAKWLAFKYLTPKHDMTSIGLLLGWSASQFGSMDSLITRVLSVHLESLLPAGSAQLNLSPSVQTAATMGIGLLYYNSQHRRMSEKMLLEMEHVDPETQTGPAVAFNRSEGYRLAAGFALGFINLGKGKDLRALRGLRVEQRLIQLATGPCDINVVHIFDQATAGATIATALIYMKTHDNDVARKIDIPQTVRRFDNVRPDLLLLRVLAKNLIMWRDISPRQEWIWESLPEDLQLELRPVPFNLLGPRATVLDFISTFPLSSSNLSLYNILAGLCWSIALKHAGTADETARDCLISYYDKITVFLVHDPQTYDERLTRDALMRFQHLLILAAATIMSGTGDLVVLKRARVLHSSVNDSSTFGFHQAAHMALGALFLGQGRFTFGTSNLAVASLLCAFYPIFPTDVLDNRAHLQAFRHFWVFAAEERCILPRDVETDEIVVTPVRVLLRDGMSLTLAAPALLPDLDMIAQIYTISTEYWQVILDFKAHPKQLASFRKHHTIYLRRKSILAQYGNQFSIALATRTEPRFGRHSGAGEFRWIYQLPLFASMGIGTAETRSIFPRGRASEERDKKRLFLIEGGRDLAFDSDDAPITNLLDSRTTGIDDVLVLNKDVESDAQDRLMGLNILFEWSHRETKRGRRLTWEHWIGEEAIDALRASVLRRLEMEAAIAGGLPQGDESWSEDAMVVD